MKSSRVIAIIGYVSLDARAGSGIADQGVTVARRTGFHVLFRLFIELANGLLLDTNLISCLMIILRETAESCLSSVGTHLWNPQGSTTRHNRASLR